MFTITAIALAIGRGQRPHLPGRKVRIANSRFEDVKVAVVEGYAPIPCTSGIDGGAMGVHYVNGEYLKDEVPDIKRPQAVMYEPLPKGKMALVAVEYITFRGPASLGGQLFSFTGAPNRYGLGPWKANLRGAFADMNPNVTCNHMSAHGHHSPSARTLRTVIQAR